MKSHSNHHNGAPITSQHPEIEPATAPIPLNPQLSTPTPELAAKPRGSTGKIGRLPYEVRDQLGQMILDGVPYRQIRQRLGIYGKGLSDNNISTWKTHGAYAAWLTDQIRLKQCSLRFEVLNKMATQEHSTAPYEAGPKMLLALLSEALMDLGPDTLRKGLAADPRNAFRVLNSFVRLLSGGLRWEKLQLEAAKRKKEPESQTTLVAANSHSETPTTILEAFPQANLTNSH